MTSRAKNVEPWLAAMRAPPADATITIPGRERALVAIALIDAALQIEQDAASRRKQTTTTRNSLMVAERLRRMAAEVTP